MTVNSDASLFFFGTYFFLSGLYTLVCLALFIYRFVVFYKKGTEYFETFGKAPKFQEIQIIFYAIGILGTLVLACIPIVRFFVLVVVIALCLKTLKQFFFIVKPARIKPEKMALFGVGMGIAGVLGFYLGHYRSASFKEEDKSV